MLTACFAGGATDHHSKLLVQSLFCQRIVLKTIGRCIDDGLERDAVSLGSRLVNEQYVHVCVHCALEVFVEVIGRRAACVCICVQVAQKVQSAVHLARVARYPERLSWHSARGERAHARELTHARDP